MNSLFGSKLFTLPFSNSKKNNNSAKKRDSMSAELALNENTNNIIKPFLINSRSLYNKNINPLTLKEKSFHSKFHKKRKDNFSFNFLESPQIIRKDFDYVKNHNEGYQNKLNDDFFKHYYRMMIRNLFYLLKKERNINSDQEIEYFINKNLNISKTVKKYIISKVEKEVLFFDEIFKLWEKKYEFRNYNIASFPFLETNENLNAEVMKKEKLFNYLKEIKLHHNEKFEEKMLKEDQFLSTVIKCLKKYGVEIISIEQYELLKGKLKSNIPYILFVDIIKNRSNFLFELKKESKNYENVLKNTTNGFINNLFSESSASASKRYEKKSFSYHEKTNTSIFPEIKKPSIQKIDLINQANNCKETLIGEVMASFPNKKIEEEEKNIFDELFELKADIIKKNLSLIKKMSSIEDETRETNKENPSTKILKKQTLERINELTFLELDDFSNEFEILSLQNPSQEYLTKLITKFLKIEEIQEFDIISEYINDMETEFRKLKPGRRISESNYQKKNTIDMDFESKTLQMDNIEEMIMSMHLETKSNFQKNLPTLNPKSVKLITKQPTIVNDQTLEIPSEHQIQVDEPLSSLEQTFPHPNTIDNVKITILVPPSEIQFPSDEIDLSLVSKKLNSLDSSLSANRPQNEKPKVEELNPSPSSFKRKEKKLTSTLIKPSNVNKTDSSESYQKNFNLSIGINKNASSRNLIQPKIIIKEEKEIPPKNAKISKKKNIKKILEKLRNFLISDESNSVSEPQRMKIVDYIKKIALILTKTRKSISVEASDEIIQIINSLPYVDNMIILNKTEVLVGNLLASAQSAQINEMQEKYSENKDIFDLDAELDFALKELENEANLNGIEIKSTRSNMQKEPISSNKFLIVPGQNNQINRGGSQRFLRKKEKEKSLIKEEISNKIEKESIKLEKKIEFKRNEKNQEENKMEKEEREKEKIEEQRIREEEGKKNRIKYLERKEEIRNFYQKLTEKVEVNAFEGFDCDEQLNRFMEETNLKFMKSGELLENYKPNMKFSNQIINPFVSLVKRQYEEEDDDDSDTELYKQSQKKYRNSELYLFEILRKKEFERQYNLILAFKRFLNNIHSVVKQGKIDANQQEKTINIENMEENKKESNLKNTKNSLINKKKEITEKKISLIQLNNNKLKSKSVDNSKKRLDEFFVESRKKCRKRMVLRIS